MKRLLVILLALWLAHRVRTIMPPPREMPCFDSLENSVIT